MTTRIDATGLSVISGLFPTVNLFKIYGYPSHILLQSRPKNEQTVLLKIQNIIHRVSVTTI